MKKITMLFITISLLVSCKAKRQYISVTNSAEKTSATELIASHERSFPDFKTLAGSVTVTNGEGENSQSISMSFRMEKDKAIWLSAPLGVAKIYITPEKVQFYNRLNNTYFDGDFSFVSNLLGFEVDFSFLQKLILGQIPFSYTSADDFSLGKDENSNQLRRIDNQGVSQVYFILSDIYRVGDALFYNENIDTKFQYLYHRLNEMPFPYQIKLKTIEPQQKDIMLEFSGLELNRTLNFPFKIPSGLKEIKL